MPTDTPLTAEVERAITDRLMAHIPTDPDDFPEFCQRVRAQLEGKDATIATLMTRAEQAEARVAELEAALTDCVEALNVEHNRIRRQYPDPDFAAMVKQLGERIGYGVMMTEASRLWFESAGGGAFSVGHCIAIQERAWEKARAAMEGQRD